MANNWNKAETIIAIVGLLVAAVLGFWNLANMSANNQLEKAVATASAERVSLQETQTSIMLQSNLPVLKTTARGEVVIVKAGEVRIAGRRFFASILVADLAISIENSGGQDDILKEVLSAGISPELRTTGPDEAVSIPLESLLGGGPRIVSGWGKSPGDYSRQRIEIPAGEEVEVFTSYTLCHMYEVAEKLPIFAFSGQVERPASIDELPNYLEQYETLIIRPTLQFLRSDPVQIELIVSLARIDEVLQRASSFVIQETCP